MSENRRWELSGALRKIADRLYQADFGCTASHRVGHAIKYCWMKAGHHGKHTNHEGEQWEAEKTA